MALWKEVRAIEDPEVRRGLLQRIAKTMASMYGEQVHGDSTAERMQSLSGVFAERDVPLEVEDSGNLPVLTAMACPYPELAERDRGICRVGEDAVFRAGGVGIAVVELPARRCDLLPVRG